MIATKTKALAALSLALGLSGAARADDVPAATGSTAPSVPVTREDMKKALEASKRNVPRIALPAPTAEEIARAEAAAKLRAEQAAKEGRVDPARSLGGGIVNNGRMRTLYLADYGTGYGLMPGGGGGQGPDFAFQTMLFWIVSRGNNCTYCMGHQEVKLASAGLSDDKIAALDGDWSEFSGKERAAFAFTKTLTFEPHKVGDADIVALRAYYTDPQIVDIITAVAGFNAMNRWTGAMRIPQEDHREYLTPTSAKYAKKVSALAQVGDKTSGFVPPAPRKRPALESRAEVEKALAAARARTPRITPADASATKAALPEIAGDDPPQWMRLMAVSPSGAASRAGSLVAAETKGKLDPRTKAILAWVTARNDRAWYALGHARERLMALGFSDDAIFALDDWITTDYEKDREVVRFAKILAVDPALITDDDFARLKRHYADKLVAEIVHQVAQDAGFNRITEAAGLRLEK